MKKIILFVSIVFVLLLASCTIKKSQTKIKNEDSKNQIENTNWQVPTVFFHGYKGTKNSFGKMLTRLSKNQEAHLGEILEVSPDGKVTIQKKNDLTKSKLLIQVLFEDNENNEWNQAQWIANVLNFLKDQGMTKVNIVGHSMGGVSGLRYLLTIPERSVSVEKFVAIGSPFVGFEKLAPNETIDDVLEKGPIVTDSRYEEFVSKMANFPKNVPWLNIAGLLEDNDPDNGDGTVPLSSSLALTAAAKKAGISYENQIFKDQHSQLHEDEEVDKRVATFLWSEKS